MTRRVTKPGSKGSPWRGVTPALVPAPAAAALIATLALLPVVVREPAPRFIWNASRSSPVGLYRVEPGRSAHVGDLVVAWPPDGARRLAAARRYLPANVPLVKKVAAAGGDRVCAGGDRLSIDGVVTARRRPSDRQGRRLGWWSGCRRLEPGELFLLSDAPDAFDGRYFGITRQSDQVGRASLLWPR